MSERNTLVRSLNDLGLAAWFGGTLAGAVGINGAAADVPDRNLAAIGAYVVGSVGLLAANKGRTVAQSGVGAASVAKTVLTGAALAATGYSRILGKKLEKAEPAPVEGGTDPAQDTPEEVAAAQRQLAVTQWVIPALTAALVVVNALHGELQRPNQQVPGLLSKPAKLLGLSD